MSGTVDLLIVLAIVALAGVYAYRRIVLRRGKSSGCCGCGCEGNCSGTGCAPQDLRRNKQ